MTSKKKNNLKIILQYFARSFYVPSEGLENIFGK